MTAGLLSSALKGLGLALITPNTANLKTHPASTNNPSRDPTEQPPHMPDRARCVAQALWPQGSGGGKPSALP